MADRFCGGASVGPAIQRTYLRFRRAMVRPRCMDHVFRTTSAVARHGELLGRHCQRVQECLLHAGRPLAFNLRWIDKWTTLQYNGLHFADDWGDQRSLMIRPDSWRRIFKPRYAEMFRRVREAGMHVWFHSDGRINEFLDDLIEIGVDVINCQVAVVGHDWIAANARGSIAFRTDIDRHAFCLLDRRHKSRKKYIRPLRRAERPMAASSPVARSGRTCRSRTSAPCMKHFASTAIARAVSHPAGVLCDRHTLNTVFGNRPDRCLAR